MKIPFAYDRTTFFFPFKQQHAYWHSRDTHVKLRIVIASLGQYSRGNFVFFFLFRTGRQARQNYYVKTTGGTRIERRDSERDSELEREREVLKAGVTIKSTPLATQGFPSTSFRKKIKR